MKGIILAGGSGTRLHPLTLAVSKQLLPVYDKPMIYYPLSTLMESHISDVLVITTKEDLSGFWRLLGDGGQFGMNIEYAVQNAPNGIAEAFIIGEKFIGPDQVMLILGDNIFHANGVASAISNFQSHWNKSPAPIAYNFAYQVKDPERYGVVEFNAYGRVVGIEEKPKKPKSNYALTGLYCYGNEVVSFAKELRPSLRGELEITDINSIYLSTGSLHVEKLVKGSVWLDTGTHDSLVEATSYVQTIEHRQGIKICCPEEIAFKNGWIDAEQLEMLGHRYRKAEYGQYLLAIARA